MRPIQICVVIDEGKTYSSGHIGPDFFDKFPHMKDEEKQYFMNRKNKNILSIKGDVYEELYSYHNQLKGSVQCMIKNLFTNDLAIIDSNGVQNFMDYKLIIKYILKDLK